MDRVGLVFVLCLFIAVVISLVEYKGRHENAIDLADVDFHTTSEFNIAGVAVSLILIALYATWWQ